MSPALPWSGPFNQKDTFDLIGLPLGGKIKNMFREKRWCYAGIVSPDIFFGAAIVHLGYAASGFCFGFDRKTCEMVEFTSVGLPLGRVRYDRNPESGICRFQAPEKGIEISGNLKTARQLRADLKNRGRSLRADIEFSGSAHGFAPMHFPMDMGRKKTAFTTKAAGLKAEGTIWLGEKKIILSGENSFALFDWTHGAYHRQTFWNWACGAGWARGPGKGSKTALGFNFSRGVYENGRLENTLWINGVPEPAGEMAFSYDPKDPLAPWKIQSKDQKIDLTFFPEGMRRADDNFWVLASRFIQPLGRFEGKITTESGTALVLENTGGVVEEHYAKW